MALYNDAARKAAATTGQKGTFRELNEQQLANQNTVQSGAINDFDGPQGTVAGQPRTLRSTSINTADGGSVPTAASALQLKNRERKLLQGLPDRTSSFERRRDLRNARVHADDRVKIPGRNGRGWTFGSNGADAAAAKALNDQYAQEDANYTQAYGALTGRQDTSAEAGLDRSNARTLQSLQNKGYRDTANINADSAYDIQGLSGAQSYDQNALTQGAGTDRANIAARGALDVTQQRGLNALGVQSGAHDNQKDLANFGRQLGYDDERRAKAPGLLEQFTGDPARAETLGNYINDDAYSQSNADFTRYIGQLAGATAPQTQIPTDLGSLASSMAFGPQQADPAQVSKARTDPKNRHDLRQNPFIRWLMNKYQPINGVSGESEFTDMGEDGLAATSKTRFARDNARIIEQLGY